MQFTVRSMNLQQFDDFMTKEIAPKLDRSWLQMIVLHNFLVLSKFWPGQDHNNHLFTPQQRLDNAKVDWESRGMTKPPHMVCTLANDVIPEDMIHVLGDMLHPGEHSKEWNHISWGVEMFASFSLEPLPDRFFVFMCNVLRIMYRTMAKDVNNNTFKLHLEDVISKHWDCPGKAAQDKARWILGIKQPAAGEVLVGLGAHPRPVPAGTGDWVAEREGYKDHAYPDGWGGVDGKEQLYAIGNGTQIYPDGTRVKLGDICTPELAAKWRDYRIASDWLHIQQLVKVPLSDALGKVLCSFTYEFNVAKLAASTFLADINANRIPEAQASFLTWDHKSEGGHLVVDNGLDKRRTMELAIWNGQDPHQLVALPAKGPQSPVQAPPVVTATKPPPKPGDAPVAPRVATAPPPKPTTVVVLAQNPPRPAPSTLVVAVSRPTAAVTAVSPTTGSGWAWLENLVVWFEDRAAQAAKARADKAKKAA